MMTRDELYRRLTQLDYPCYFVAHGPARDYRTTYRSEHSGAFRSGLVSDPDAALSLIDGARYPGHYHEMDLIAISVGDDYQLVETVLR